MCMNYFVAWLDNSISLLLLKNRNNHCKRSVFLVFVELYQNYSPFFKTTHFAGKTLSGMIHTVFMERKRKRKKIVQLTCTVFLRPFMQSGSFDMSVSMAFRSFVMSILLNSLKYSSWLTHSGSISTGSPFTLDLECVSFVWICCVFHCWLLLCVCVCTYRHAWG